MNNGNIEDFGQTRDEVCVASPELKEYHNSLEKTCERSILGDSPKQYTTNGEIYRPVGSTVGFLKSGVYDVNIDDHGVSFSNKVILSDHWLNFRDDLVVQVMDEIEKFWDSSEAFKKYGFLQRRGYLLYGPAGTGKSVLINQIIHQLISKDGIVFIGENPNILVAAIKIFRKIEPSRKIIVVLEDIDAIIQRYGESTLLSYLDGEDSSNYVINICSTNYPEKLDRRLVNRPRRIDRLIHITFPDAKMRSHFFKEKMGIDGEELDKWVTNTEKFTFAGLTELVISVKCLGNDFEVAIKNLRSLLDAKPSSENFDNNRKVGFV